MLPCALAAVLACGHAEPKSPNTAGAPAPAPAAPSCADVRTNLMSILSAAKEAPKEAVEEVGEVLATHCRDDAWSVDARICLAKATVDTVKTCENQLTQAQQRAVEDDLNRRHPERGGAGATQGTSDRPRPANAPMSAPPQPTPASDARPKGVKPPPPPASPKPTRDAPRKAPVHDSSDPCEGGQ